MDKTVAILETMVQEADGDHEVTLPMLIKRRRLPFSERRVADKLHARGYHFRKLRSKTILTPEDVKARYAFAQEYRRRSEDWWRQHIHIHLDNHHFKVATTARGRKLLAKRRVRGVWRKKEKSLRTGTCLCGVGQSHTGGEEGR